MARYSFLTTDGPDQGKTFYLNPGITFIGRRENPAEDEPEGSSRWVLTDPAVSRTHARIDWDGAQAPVLVHLSSTNATLLDGRIVTGQSIEDGQSLSHGNLLRMGQTAFEVLEEQDAECRWYLEQKLPERSEHRLGQEDTMELDGVTFNCRGAVVEAVLAEDTAEAYLLRMIGDQYWTTSLKPKRAVPLKNRDVIRTEYRKVVLVDRNA